MKNKLYLLFSILFCTATLFMGVGYASINSISLNMKGDITPQLQNGIFITVAKYNEELSKNVIKDESVINSSHQTNFNSSIVLSNEIDSQITYDINIYNSTEFEHEFVGVEYTLGQDTYDNENINFKLTNLNKKDKLKGKDSINFSITFYYNDSNISNVELNSILNFKFKETHKVIYNNVSNSEDLPTYALEGETLTIDFTALDYYYFAIFMGEKKLVLNEDYTFENMILTIPNIDDTVEITTFGAVTNGLITLSNQYTNTPNMYGDFRILAKDADFSNSQGSCTYSKCYSDNSGKFEYTTDGGLKFDSNNQIGVLNIDSSMKITNQYSVYMTLKADANQIEPNGNYSTAAIAMSEDGSPYLIWIGFYDGYLHIYSYKKGNKKQLNSELSEEGFLSINATKYSNKIINLQITAVKGNKTKLYINGELIKTFTSGNVDTIYNQATLGDLRPGRGLKFNGIIYDVALYNRALTANEIALNWNYANEVWKIS